MPQTPRAPCLCGVSRRTLVLRIRRWMVLGKRSGPGRTHLRRGIGMGLLYSWSAQCEHKGSGDGDGRAERDGAADCEFDALAAQQGLGVAVHKLLSSGQFPRMPSVTGQALALSFLERAPVSVCCNRHGAQRFHCCLLRELAIAFDTGDDDWHSCLPSWLGSSCMLHGAAPAALLVRLS